MKKPSKKLLKTLLFSAAMSLIHSSAKADEPVAGVPLSPGDIGDGSRFGEFDNLKKKVIKNVYTIKRDGETKLIASHRSHQSHRSHSSSRHGNHYSHSSSTTRSSRSYGGSSYGGSSGSSYGGSTNSLYTPSTSTPKAKPQAKTIETYSLGDRTLSSGSYGADVTQLTTLLVQNYYMNVNSVNFKSSHSLYDKNVVTAVKNFQKDAGLSQTGKVDATTAAKLQSWDSSQTTIQLGVRDLTYSSNPEIEGYDVTELVELLKKAGYPPNPSLIRRNGIKTTFTQDIVTAVKMFQAYNGLPVTGMVDSNTLTKLRAKAK